MSYIRCLSNPEELYVWSHNTRIYWSQTQEPRDISFWESEFLDFIKHIPNWHCMELFTHKDFSIDEDKEFKIALSYKGKVFSRLWLVTWKYVYDNFKNDA